MKLSFFFLFKSLLKFIAVLLLVFKYMYVCIYNSQHSTYMIDPFDLFVFHIFRNLCVCLSGSCNIQHETCGKTCTSHLEHSKRFFFTITINFYFGTPWMLLSTSYLIYRLIYMLSLNKNDDYILKTLNI